MTGRTIVAVPGLELTSETFRCRLLDMAERLGLDPGWIAAVMAVETARTFDPSIRNPYSGFVGLIQFGKDAATFVGTTIEALGHMGAVEQLRYVELFFRPNAKRIHSVADCYLAVFAPKFIGADPSTVVYAKPTKAYEQNKALDKSGDGTITVAEATAPAVALLAEGKKRGTLPASPWPWQPLVGGLVLFSTVAGLFWRFTR